MSGEKAENKDFFEIKAENKSAIMDFVKDIADDDSWYRSDSKLDKEDIDELADSQKKDKINDLLGKLGLSLGKGLEVSEIETKINQFIKEKQEKDKFIILEKARISLEASQSIIDNFDIDSDRKDETKVKALQRVLKARLHDLGKYGPNKDGVDGDMTLNGKTMEAYKIEKSKSNNVSDTIDNQASENEEVSQSIIDNFDIDLDRKNKPKVIALQKFLKKKGYKLRGKNDGVDGDFGGSTKKAYEEAKRDTTGKNQELINNFNPDTSDKNKIEELQRTLKKMGYELKGKNAGVDGDFGASSKKAYEEAFLNINGNTPDTAELVDYLKSVDKYLSAFNKVYGGQGDFISKHNGVFGLIYQLSYNDLERLFDELKGDFPTLNDSSKQEKFASEMGLKVNSDRFKEGCARTASIAILSVIASGGASTAIELFAVNYGHNYERGPEVNKILKGLGKGDVDKQKELGKGDVDIKKELRDVLLDKNTTVEGINLILDILNNPNMDTANLKRYLEEIFQPNWFAETFGIFTPDNYFEVEELIEKFSNSGDIEDAKEALTAYYEFAYKSFVETRKKKEECEEAYKSLPEELKDTGKYDFISNGNGNRKIKKAYLIVRRYEKSIENYNKAYFGISSLGNSIKKYVNLDAKRKSIEGEKFDLEGARTLEKGIDSQLGERELKNITEKLHSEQSFGYKVELSKIGDSGYMDELVEKMKNETINGETSVLAGVIRGVMQHYGINFSPDEFIEAFKNAEKVGKNEEVYIISNLGRERNQKFQGTAKSGLLKIDINGTNVYFKDVCTNVVTVSGSFDTTTNSENSIPVVYSLDLKALAGDNKGKGISGESDPGTGGPGDLPDPVPDPDPGGIPGAK